jgi:hypothetical protein
MTPEDEASASRDGEGLDQESLVSVREVPDEAAATLLCDFLRAQGIEARTAPVQMPWLGTLQTLQHGYWGKVEVLGKDAARARALVEEYLSATPERDPGEEKA